MELLFSFVALAIIASLLSLKRELDKLRKELYCKKEVISDLVDTAIEHQEVIHKLLDGGTAMAKLLLQITNKKINGKNLRKQKGKR